MTSHQFSFFFFLVGIANMRQGILLTLVPWALAWKGPQIRAKSKIASVGPLPCICITECR